MISGGVFEKLGAMPATVEVYDRDAEHVAEATGRWLRQLAREKAAVVHAGQPVAVGLIAQLVLE